MSARPVSVAHLADMAACSSYFVTLDDRRTYRVDRYFNLRCRVRTIPSGRAVTLAKSTLADIGDWIARIEARS